MLSIGLLGNCQVSGIAACISKMAPEHSLTVVDLAKLRGDESKAQAAEDLHRCDVILAQPRVRGDLGGLSTDTLPAERMILFPAIGFVGFHPDMFRPWPAADNKLGMMGHSALLMAAFLRGLPIERALDLYNAYFFSRLGYMSMDKSIRKMIRLWGVFGFDIAPLIDGWLEEGAFMHTSNHPKIRVLKSVADLLLKRLNVSFDSSAELPPDHLGEGAAWAIWPEIARQVSVPAVSTYRLSRRRMLSCEEFATLSYSYYEKVSPDELRVPPVDVVEGVLAAEVR